MARSGYSLCLGVCYWYRRLARDDCGFGIRSPWWLIYELRAPPKGVSEGSCKHRNAQRRNANSMAWPLVCAAVDASTLCEERVLPHLFSHRSATGAIKLPM